MCTIIDVIALIFLATVLSGLNRGSKSDNSFSNVENVWVGFSVIIVVLSVSYTTFEIRNSIKHDMNCEESYGTVY